MLNKEVRTRFAPSPTGGLHIGSMRTILFNWLHAKNKNGKFLLRIEDTDKDRNQEDAVKKIFDSMNWLNLKHDEEVVTQSNNIERHKEVALKLLAEGKAYKCFATQEELDEMRQKAIDNKQTPKYDRRWRDVCESQHPDKDFVIRLKAPLNGFTEFKDLVLGDCKVNNEHMDDMILLRSNGVPTYMLAVVVDDHDMKITDVVRGGEHLNNAYRQKQIYDACGWECPNFAHIPLIHAEDGTKLSKRTGAVDILEYKKHGFLPQALLNYLVRLGWSYKDKEIMSMDECVELFDITKVGSSPARFNLDKMLSVNSHYLKEMEDVYFFNAVELFAKENSLSFDYGKEARERGIKGSAEVKVRVRTLLEAYEMLLIFLEGPGFFGKIENCEIINHLILEAEKNPWEADAQSWLREKIAEKEGKLKDVAKKLRVALTKKTVSPSLFEIMQFIGPDIFVQRLKNSIKVDI